MLHSKRVAALDGTAGPIRNSSHRRVAYSTKVPQVFLAFVFFAIAPIVVVIRSLAAFCFEPLQSINELDESGRSLGRLDETMTKEVLGRRTLSRVSLQTEGDKLAEGLREAGV